MAKLNRAISVLGSANMDLVVRVERQPAPGETIFGTEYHTVPGGKGLNQAVAAARAGGDVSFLGAVGSDDFGSRLLQLLVTEGIGIEGVQQVPVPTGTAHITVDASGQNSIIVISGANDTVEATQLFGRERTAGWLMTQLELPLATVTRALEWAKASGHTTVLTPAPARTLDPGLLRCVDLLVPNEVEACQLAGVDNAIQAAANLSRLSTDVVVTMGEAGSVWARSGEIMYRADSVPASAVDTTGAGDTYVGILVTMLAGGLDMPDSMRWASLGAAISVSRRGATSSMPRRAELESVATRATGPQRGLKSW